MYLRKAIMMGDVKPINEGIINRMSYHLQNGFVVVSSSWGGFSTDNDEVNKLRMRKYEEWLKVNEQTANEKTKIAFFNHRNKSADNRLRNLIAESKYSFSPVFGGYHPNSNSNEDIYECSYVIYNQDKKGIDKNFDFTELEDFAIELCNIFVQECVYVQRPNEPALYVNMDGDIIATETSNPVKINREDEMFYTTSTRDTHSMERFTSDMNFHNPIRGQRHKEHDESICESIFLDYYYKKGYDYYERMKKARQGEIFLD